MLFALLFESPFCKGEFTKIALRMNRIANNTAVNRIEDPFDVSEAVLVFVPLISKIRRKGDTGGYV